MIIKFSGNSGWDAYQMRSISWLSAGLQVMNTVITTIIQDLFINVLLYVVDGWRLLERYSPKVQSTLSDSLYLCSNSRSTQFDIHLIYCLTSLIVYRSFSNGCLPNELYHAIIAWVACFQQSPHKHLGICAQVCHIWSNIDRKYQNANIILDHDNLSNYIRFIHQNPYVCRLVQSIDHQRPFTDDASYSVATQIILLIHRLPNIQKLTLCIRQWNNIHPDILKHVINNKTVNSLDITSGYHDKKHPLHWLWQFFACFHSLKTLSLDLYASSFVMNTYSLEYLYQKKLKASLRSLKIYIYTLNHTMLLDSLIQAGAFTSNLKILHIITYINSATTQTELEQLSSAIQALLMHCSNHLQEFMHSDNHIPVSLNLLSSKSKLILITYDIIMNHS